MSTKKRGLGRGLSELGLPELFKTIRTPVPSTHLAQENNDPSLKFLSLDIIKPGKYQPRRSIDPQSLEELTASIKKQGVIQPIVVRPQQNSYELIAGERRWRAAKAAGLETIPAIVRDIPDNTAIAFALIENIQRYDLNPMEESYALQRLLDEFGMTHQEVAETVGKSRSTITNLLRLQNLQAQARKAIEEGKIEMGHARALLTLDNQQQNYVVNEIIMGDLSVRETERLVQSLQNPNKVTKNIKKQQDPNIVKLENSFSDRLNTDIKIRHNEKGRSQLIIFYDQVEELEAILQKIH